ncbi:DNAJ protein JJJ1 homolog isoform X2 [Prosopis cineraria]|uniref:DNAJ protein JJJ1 homolog isoform X2 n=1 Tax=Prosopis cineraria TaxID=364024 RepID=UPI00240F03F1|nr:DNAJ protein JJJ1 homolog isoform X2 [Prosopis cineraria]
MTSGNRCHYEVLGLQRDCTPDEIRSAYRRLALQRHPDKLVKSGLSQAEATAQFQELQHAYEVLSDPKERAWYDSHRSQILFSDPNSVGNSVPNSFIPNLFSFFSTSVYSGYSDSGKGFYKVYSDVFDKIHANEINFARKLGLGIDVVRQAPVMGNSDSPYAQVTAFYNYWLGFSTVMDFCWVDEFDVMAGPNRKSRRLMEEENSKIRKKAKKEYNDTVRKLADFVKKRDKRVIDMKVKKNMEMEKKKEEERERKKQLEKEKKERAMAYEEPEWAKVEEDEEDEADWFEEGTKKKNAENEFYCVLCGKKFKSEKQWKNHEQSKKHKEKVAEFRDSLDDEEDVEVEVGERGGKMSSESYEDRIGVNDDISGSTDNEIDDLEGRIKDGLNVAEGVTRNGVELNEEEEEEEEDEDEFLDAQHQVGEEAGVSMDFDEEEDDELGVLEAMLAGQRSRNTGAPRQECKASVRSPNDFMKYDTRKNSRKKREAKKEKGRELSEDFKAEDFSPYNVENESNSKENGQVSIDKKASNPRIDKKGAAKDKISHGKNSSKTGKAKGTSKNLVNICEACGEEFESRNKLHKHLGETGHATIKSPARKHH